MVNLVYYLSVKLEVGYFILIVEIVKGKVDFVNNYRIRYVFIIIVMKVVKDKEEVMKDFVVKHLEDDYDEPLVISTHKLYIFVVRSIVIVI